jgi:hypothetical protein
VAIALTTPALWTPIPADQRWWMKPILDATNPLGNQLFDWMQKDINTKLKNFGAADAGIFNFIPQNLR